MRKKREDTIEKNTKIDGRMVDTTCFYSFVRSFLGQRTAKGATEKRGKTQSSDP